MNREYVKEVKYELFQNRSTVRKAILFEFDIDLTLLIERVTNVSSNTIKILMNPIF